MKYDLREVRRFHVHRDAYYYDPEEGTGPYLGCKVIKGIPRAKTVAVLPNSLNYYSRSPTPMSPNISSQQDGSSFSAAAQHLNAASSSRSCLRTENCQIYPNRTSCVEGERLTYIRKRERTLDLAHEQKQVLVRKVKDGTTPTSSNEIDELKKLCNENTKLNQEISEAMEVGKLKLEKRKKLEKQKIEDNCYERYGFVFIEAEPLPNLSTPPKALVNFNKKSQNGKSCMENHHLEEMEKEMEKLRKRLDNLGKSPKAPRDRKEVALPADINKLKIQTGKSEQKKCSIV